MFNRFRILIVDDEEVIREGCCRVLSKEDYKVKSIASGKDGLRLAKESPFDLILLDLKMPDIDGLEALSFFKEQDPDVVVIIITGYPDVQTAVNAMKLGAYDYISKPFTPEALRLIVKRGLEKRTLILENKYLKEKLNVTNQSEQIIGKSEPMQRIYGMIRKIAPTDSTVLVTGESGTGKELIAKAIHAHSLRRDNEFVAVDCGALVETLLESELFGHVKGSFTGATQTKHGSLELANGGTFFFDEVSNLSLNMQSKLLRVIQEREIKPVGSEKKVPIDVRIIAATNQDLRNAIKEKTFREDLYYRLSVFPIRLPPLKERAEDIPLLVEHFVNKYNKKKRKLSIRVAQETMDLLLRYTWPGNIRELGNTIERAMILTDDGIILPEDLPWYIRDQREDKGGILSKGLVSLQEVEKMHIEYVLDKTRWNKSKTAEILGIDRKTLYQKVKKYSLVQK
ncbi:MAG: sigma-54 dependent transcriptional regulator [Thermodesulfobacteriota bacterium]|nr:sigma-54 dependent transcriptional regulator [Thermodesulfobacteriota bacterium]